MGTFSLLVYTPSRFSVADVTSDNSHFSNFLQPQIDNHNWFLIFFFIFLFTIWSLNKPSTTSLSSRYFLLSFLVAIALRQNPRLIGYNYNSASRMLGYNRIESCKRSTHIAISCFSAPKITSKSSRPSAWTICLRQLSRRRLRQVKDAAPDLQRYQWYIGTGPTFNSEN